MNEKEKDFQEFEKKVKRLNKQLILSAFIIIIFLLAVLWLFFNIVVPFWLIEG